MTIFILTFLFVLCMVAAMAVGVIVSNKPIKGSCGGIQALGLGEKCDICGSTTDRCEGDEAQKNAASKSQTRYYNAAD